MKRTASAVWKGDLTSGEGMMSTQSGVMKDQKYSFKTRFEDAPGTNPEELIAAAHAGCFSMAFSHELASAGHKPESVSTRASVQLDKVEGGFSISRIELTTEARVPGADKSEVEKIADAAKKGCPVSKVLNAEIVLNLTVSV